MPKELYEFKERVAVSKWYDGDTFYGALDQGVGIFRAGGFYVDPFNFGIVLEPIRMRCAIIDAPELMIDGVANAPGFRALQYARELVPPGIYPCLTYKADDTFDRPLIDILLSDNRRFSGVMLVAGHAVLYK